VSETGLGYWERRWTGYRHGGERLALEWPGGRAEAAVYDEGVPRISRAVLAALPLEVPVMHVAWSGDMLMGVEPIDLGVPEAENDVRLPRPGDLGWDPKIGELTFTYGLAECHGPTGPNTIVIYGTIDAGLDEFAAFARARRYEGVGTLTLTPAR
jgi:hypothetical protein